MKTFVDTCTHPCNVVYTEVESWSDATFAGMLDGRMLRMVVVETGSGWHLSSVKYRERKHYEIPVVMSFKE